MFSFSSRSIPALPSLSLSDQEKDLVASLSATGQPNASEMAECQAFYLGRAAIRNLRIAVPKELEPHLDAVVGWGASAVDPLVERLSVDGFRLPDADEADDTAAALMAANGLDAEFPIAFTDALSAGAAYLTAGSPDEAGGMPVLTVDSPLNMYAHWDVRASRPKAALQVYREGLQERATLLLPRLSLHLVRDDKGNWELVKRDEHGFDFVPVTRMPNLPMSHDRSGRSEINKPLQSLIVEASRTLRALGVAREIYSTPQRLIMNATQEAFQNADGSAKTALETYMTSVLVLEGNGDMEAPVDVKQLAVYDPSVFTRVVDMYAAQASGILAAVPQDLGIYTEGNPPSAEAVAASESRRDRRAELRQRYFGPALVRAMQDGLRFMHGGVLPDQYRRLVTDWNPVSVETPAVTADAISKQVAAGSVSPTSDVILKRLGYNAVERRQLVDDARRERVTSAARAATEQMAAGNADRV